MTNKIHVGLVGGGWMGSTLLARLAEREDVVVAGLCGRNEGRARDTLVGLGLSPELYRADYDALLATADLDAVVLAAPNHLHGPQAIAALQAGKHVFCEKPAANRYDEFLQQIALEQNHPELITFVDYLLYFDTFQERLRRMVAEDELGQISQIQVNYRHPVNIAGDKAWKLSRDIMGDAIGMGVIHALSAMVYIMASQAQPIRVYATSRPAQVRPFEPDPIWNIQIEFDNGASGFCFGNIDNSNGYDAYHNLQGSEGALVFDSGLDRPQKVRYWSEKTTGGKWVYPLDTARCASEGVEPWPADTTTPDSGDVVEHQTGNCVGHFIEHIHAGTPSPLSFVNSKPIADIGWAAQMSAAQGCPIDLPLDEEVARAFFEAQDQALAGAR